MNSSFKLAIAILAVSVGGLWLNAVYAASFDCAQARTRVEKFICADPFISKLDSRLRKIYEADLVKANLKQKQRLITDERYWLKDMRNLCTTQTCFKQAYWSRLAELETFYGNYGSVSVINSNKAEIRGILSRMYWYPYPLNNNECSNVWSSLRSMKEIDFIKPRIHALSYWSQGLEKLRRRVTKECSSGHNEIIPVNFEYACSPETVRMSGYRIGGAVDSTLSKDGLRICDVYYGVPPFDIYVIPNLKGPGVSQYIFHYSGVYGPMNKPESPAFGRSFKSTFFQVLPSCGRGGYRVSLASGTDVPGKPSYFGVFNMGDNYYAVMLLRIYGGYTLKVNRFDGASVSGCAWSTIK